MPPSMPSRYDRAAPRRHSPRQKRSVFEAVDHPKDSQKSLQDNKRFVEDLEKLDDSSSLSDVSSNEITDTPLSTSKQHEASRTEEEDEGEIDWEDAMEPKAAHSSKTSVDTLGDLDLTLNNSDQVGLPTDNFGGNKGPSKIERQIRNSTHRMHVQFLLFHNLMRSRWACDLEVQQTLLRQLPSQIQAEIDKWRVDSGLRPSDFMSTTNLNKMNSRGRNALVQKERKQRYQRDQRDWGKPAERQENGEPNMSHGDPIIRLLRSLCTYWRENFTITAPGLRKQGYKSLRMLEEDIASFREDYHDPITHGERINGIQGFREAARVLQGSRDVAAQLFTALLRGLGIEARLVASLQPIGFGWSKSETATVRRGPNMKSMKRDGVSELPASTAESDQGGEDATKGHPINSRTKWPGTSARQGESLIGSNDAPIDLSEDATISDDESVVDMTPGFRRKKDRPQYDRDLLAPNYWSEVISPITFHVYPVDSLVSKIPVITSPEYFARFEPRGVKAEKSKQVFAYVIAYSTDGTAKDVTTRYLKRHIWPGRTKGFRVPLERIPLYDKKGKIRGHQEYDWFKTVMSGYERPYSKRTVMDDLEEEKDLKPARIEKKKNNAREDTLQYYKNSAEFVLERHLRREEAIKPASKSVRTFVSGKGVDSKEEPVYKREDIEVCRTGESWHKEGRAVNPGEQPLKMVPIRAVTLNRKREVEEAERDSGEKQKQGLYARNQTDWIIPPPIENGRIPKNGYGNIDCFVPTMVPKGAVHVPLRKTVMICKKLGIDYAEAVTGFEFGNKMAVPVIEGVVIAKEHEKIVLERWEKDERERKIKEDGKREKMALGTWRKWLMGLRIIQRVKEEYGGDAHAHMKEQMNPFTNQRKASRGKPGGRDEKGDRLPLTDDDGIGGGFVIDNDNDQDDETPDFSSRGIFNKEVPHYGDQSVFHHIKPMTHASDCSLVTLTTNALGQQLNDDGEAPELIEYKTILNAQVPQPELAETSLTPQSASVKTEVGQRKASTIGQKRKATSTSDASRKAEVIRSTPKRRAARQSATAITSHYLDPESENNGIVNGENEESSESVKSVGQSFREKRRRTGRRSTEG